MSPNSHKPLIVAFCLAALFSAAFAVLLYVDEDLRRSTFVLLEKTVNEQGEEEIRVKVEKPKPNQEQIREITRNKERKKEESLKEKAKAIRKSLVEIDEITENLKKELPAYSKWNRLYRMVEQMQQDAETTAAGIDRSNDLELFPSLPENFDAIQKSLDGIHQQISIFLTVDPSSGETNTLLENSREMNRNFEPLYQALDDRVREVQEENGGWRLSKERKRVGELKNKSWDYLKELEQLLEERAALGEENIAELEDQPDTEMLASVALEQLPTDEQLEEMNVAELYENIQEMTELGDQVYAVNRAAELAATENISLEEARGQIYAPETHTGPDLQEALQQNNPTNLEAYEAYSDSLNQAEQAAANMARTAANRQQQAVPGGTKNAQNPQGNTQTAEQLQQALARRAGAMAQMNTMASNQGRPNGNLQDMRGLMMQAYQMQGGGSDGGTPGSDGRILSLDYQSDLNVLGKAKPAGNQRPIRLNLHHVLRQAIPGRRLSANAERKGWIFLDTWYIIGPWERPKLNSFNTRFPPEVEVDLDGEYSGKTHPRTKKPLNLQWRFVQTDNIRVNPPDELSDSVYYGYTEVFADRAMEVVVAVASDDIAKLWVNNLVVWEDEGLSAWQIDEGFRRIMLKPGYNKVLVRVENGPAVCYFSVLFSPVDALKIE